MGGRCKLQIWGFGGAAVVNTRPLSIKTPARAHTSSFHDGAACTDAGRQCASGPSYSPFLGGTRGTRCEGSPAGSLPHDGEGPEAHYKAAVHQACHRKGPSSCGSSMVDRHDRAPTRRKYLPGRQRLRSHARVSLAGGLCSHARFKHTRAREAPPGPIICQGSVLGR